MKMPNKDNVQKLMKFVEKADDWTVPSKDDDLDEASEETRRNWAKGKEAGSGFQRFGPIDHSKEKGSLENPRDIMGHWRDEGVARKRNVSSPWGGMPRQFPVQQEGGTSGPVTGSTHRYGKREDYDTSNASKWEEVKPSSARERARMGMENSLQKEGEGGGDGGAFNGLSDTVFTSTNAGIFSPTYGGRGTKKKQLKNHKRQDKKRKKLMGKEKKSGVERLVQFLYDGSPHMAKRMGLAPGLDDNKTGHGATGHAWNNRTHSPVVLNWKKDVTEDALNHKRTSRPLEDALKTAEDNEPHINMGLPGGMEASVLATEPRDDSANPVGNAKTRRSPDWGKHNSYVQKAVPPATTFISPDGNNESADGPHPQKAFIDGGGDNPNEAPHKDAVIKENDMQRKRKQESNTEPEGSQPVAGLGLQMAAYGSGPDTFAQDALARGGAKDTEDPEVTQEESDAMWIPEAEKVAKLEAMRKMLEDSGDETPLISALFAVDGE